MRSFDSLSERELLALAICNEEEDGRVYAGFARGLAPRHPASARVFAAMAAEEGEHRRRLIDVFVERFGPHIPLVRRGDVRGWMRRRPFWRARAEGIDAVRAEARRMEEDAARFYRRAAGRMSDAAARRLLGDLAAAEDGHAGTASALLERELPAAARAAEDEGTRRRFVLQVVQPGLVGLMDGSVSTLAPLFAAAFATRDAWAAFLVGMAAAVGAGISMGFAEAVSDDGRLSGRGTPWLRGVVCGLMTLAGGVGHTLPYLIPDFWLATVLAVAVVALELAGITWIQWRYMGTPPLSAAAKVGLGGGLVLVAGVLIGGG